MIAVITGDIISSASGTEWLEVLKQFLSQWGDSPEEWDIFRGDSFQFIVPEPEDAVYRALHLKAHLMSHAGMNVRMGIGIGTADRSSTNISESTGEAFLNSGEIFDNLKNRSLAIRSPWHEFDGYVNACLGLAMHIADRWTDSSAEAIRIQLENPEMTQVEMARLLDITQGRISERLQRGAFDEMMLMNDKYIYWINKYIH